MHGIHSGLIHLSKSVMKIWRITLEVNTNEGIEKIGLVNVNIENTSWKVRACGIYARVVDVSEIERVRFLIQKQRVRKYRTKHFPWYCVYYKHTETVIILAAFLF